MNYYQYLLFLVALPAQPRTTGCLRAISAGIWYKILDPVFETIPGK